MKNIISFLAGIGLTFGLVMMVVVWRSFPIADHYLTQTDIVEIVSWEWKEPQHNKSIDGKTIIINEKFYEKGLGAHAHTEVVVSVPPGYTHFVSDIGIDDEVVSDSPASVQYLIFGDGSLLYESSVIRADMPPKRVDVNVEWISRLRLIITNGGDSSNSDHADWAGARFVRR